VKCYFVENESSGFLYLFVCGAGRPRNLRQIFNLTGVIDKVFHVNIFVYTF